LNHKDLKKYKAKIELPIIGSYRGKQVVTMAPPAGGAVLMSVLNILENYSKIDLDKSLDSHRLVESLKYAYAQRGYYGDPIDVHLN
jgi:gamma-glutamyltranspeptidase/glutathione hydrolase